MSRALRNGTPNAAGRLAVVGRAMAAALIALAASEALAQGNIPLPGSTLGNTSMNTSRGLGGTFTAKPGNLFSATSRTTGTTGTSGTSSTTGRTGSTTGTQGQAMSPSLSSGGWLIQRQHGAGAFVGSDSGDAAGFVGLQQAEDTAAAETSLATSLRSLLNRRVNMIMPPRKTTDLYYPQVVVGFDYTPRAADQISSAVTRQVMTHPGLKVTTPIEVSVEGTTATLRGAVASERDRALVEQMVLFEPGISSVRNLLTLSAPPPVPPPPSSPSNRSK